MCASVFFLSVCPLNRWSMMLPMCSYAVPRRLLFSVASPSLGSMLLIRLISASSAASPGGARLIYLISRSPCLLTRGYLDFLSSVNWYVPNFCSKSVISQVFLQYVQFWIILLDFWCIFVWFIKIGQLDIRLRFGQCSLTYTFSIVRGWHQDAHKAKKGFEEMNEWIKHKGTLRCTAKLLPSPSHTIAGLKSLLKSI